MGSNAERNTLTINSNDVPIVVGDNVIERLQRQKNMGKVPTF